MIKKVTAAATSEKVRVNAEYGDKFAHACSIVL